MPWFDDMIPIRKSAARELLSAADRLVEATTILRNLDTLLDFKDWAETGGAVEWPKDGTLLRQRLLEATAFLASHDLPKGDLR